MAALQRLRRIGLFLSLFYLSLIVPLAGMIYLPQWYVVNCHWHDRCERFGQESSRLAIGQLTQFFRHQGELSGRWSEKEIRHLSEVRGMFDRLLLAALLAAVVLALTYEKRRLARAALISATSIAAMLLVLPFFATFWRDVFHPLLFSNNLWRNTPDDVSYYIMPRVFFKHSTALLIGTACLLNLGLGLGLRRSLRER